MSISTTALGTAGETTERVARPSLLSRAFSAMIKARERQAHQRVQAYLATLSDKQLVDLGFDGEETKRIRTYAGLPHSFNI